MRGGGVRVRGGGVRVRGGGVRMRGGGVHVRRRGGVVLMHDRGESSSSDENRMQVDAGDGEGQDEGALAGGEEGARNQPRAMDPDVPGGDDDDTHSDDDDDENNPHDDYVLPDFDWVDADDEYQNQHIPFTGTPGIQVDTENFRPVDYFKLFMNDDILNHITAQTNLFAEQYIRNHNPLPPHSDCHMWTPTNPREMTQFLGLLLLMGIMKKPTIDMYWSTDILYSTPLFAQTMTRLRFRLLLRFLHFNDNTMEPDRNDPQRDRLFKVRPLLDHLNEQFQNVYTPERDISIDESLVLWKGRLIFKQYIPLKRARFGIKVFCLCEASGYLWKFRVYTGKEDPCHDVNAVLPRPVHNFTKSEKAVLFMAHELLHKGYVIYMDNFYTSVKLYNYLHEHGTLACGTIRQNRVPRAIKEANIPLNGIICKSAGPMLCIKFRDRQDVHILTTQHDVSTRVQVRGRRRRGQPPGPHRDKPRAVVQYNSHMGGVDKQDQVWIWFRVYFCAC